MRTGGGGERDDDEEEEEEVEEEVVLEGFCSWESDWRQRNDSCNRTRNHYGGHLCVQLELQLLN